MSEPKRLSSPEGALAAPQGLGPAAMSGSRRSPSGRPLPEDVDRTRESLRAAKIETTETARNLLKKVSVSRMIAVRLPTTTR
jgi:hypothetical protein